jgi:L-lactate dehydrogenase complex protein LldF
MMEKPKVDLRERTRRALKDEQMRKAVHNAVDRLCSNKEKAASEMPNWDDWREQGKRIRKHTIENLDYYLAQLTSNVRGNGGQVYFASTAAEARNIITDICNRHKPKLIIKSKSMVTEEIHLNKALIAKGMAVVETDLAEYILQLADETPSHIIVPAIHKNRYQIAELFSKVAGYKVEADTPSLTAFARKTLRSKFMEADIGITGCNFAIADSGVITLVTNEGNARITTALPKVLITVMGMERVLPTFEDLEAILSLLPRSATGQKLTSYVSVVNGAHQAGEVDGAEEFHLVIVDNGRSRILADKEFRQALHCTRCGACFNVCPVYRQIGGHAYGSVYGGPIGAVITPLLEDDLDFWGQLSYASTLCAACSRACSVKIPLHDLLIKLRHQRVEAGHTDFMEKMSFKVWRSVFKLPGTLKFAMKMAGIAQKPLVRNGYIKAGPPPLSNWTNSRYFPAAADKTFHQRWNEKNKH